MALQPTQGHEIKGALVGAFQHHGRCAAVGKGLFPPQGAHAPAVSGLEAFESVLGARRDQVVAALELLVQELHRHAGADDMAARVLRVGVAAAVSKPAGQWVVRAGHQLGRCFL